MNTARFINETPRKIGNRSLPSSIKMLPVEQYLFSIFVYYGLLVTLVARDPPTCYAKKIELVNKLSAGLYREVMGSPVEIFLLPLVKAVCRAFTDLQELRYGEQSSKCSITTR